MPLAAIGSRVAEADSLALGRDHAVDDQDRPRSRACRCPRSTCPGAAARASGPSSPRGSRAARRSRGRRIAGRRGASPRGSRSAPSALSSSSLGVLLLVRLEDAWMSAVTTSRLDVDLETLFMVSRHMPSCFLKSAPSLGICRMMSSEPKIGSRYCQTPCTLSQMSMRSWMSTSLVAPLLRALLERLDEGRALHRLRLDDVVVEQQLDVVDAADDVGAGVAVLLARRAGAAASRRASSSAFSSDHSLEAAPGDPSSSSRCCSRFIRASSAASC